MGLLDDVLNSAAEEVTKKLAENLIPDFSKIDVSRLPERSKGLIGKANEERKEQVKQMASGIKDKVDTNFKKLNTNINLLYNCAIQLTPRMIGYITDMIGTCAVGPTININKIPTIIGQLKNDSEVLGKAYNDTETSLKEALMGLDPSQFSGDSPVGKLVDTITTTLSSVAPLLAVFGISRGGINAEGNEPEITPPIEPPELIASECENYEADDEHTSINPETQEPWPEERKYCKKFEAIFGKTVDDFQDTPEKTAQEQYDEWLAGTTCNDCKFFKKK